MNAIALILSTLLLSQAAQDSEADRLRKEAEKLRADNAVVLRQLEVLAAQVKELNEKLAKTEDLKKLALLELQATREKEIQALENQRAAKAKAPAAERPVQKAAKDALEALLAKDREAL